MIASLVIALLQSWSGHRPITIQSAPGADSTPIVRSVRSAQASFESFRRAHLPTGHGFGGPCDIRIGRYCYWRGDESEEIPPVESPDIRQRREQLIGALDSASRLLTGDAWIAGQRVRYLVEAGRSEDALRYARADCRAAAHWCNALAGYAAHSANRFATADSAYAAALAAMEPAERCRWFDVSNVLSDELEHRFTQLDCDGRERLARRVFRLGAPLYSVSTSDLLTEHLARLTRARIAEHSATIDGEPWDDDARELMTRYGWPRWYSRSEPGYGSQARPSITGHDAGMPYDFLPARHAIDSIGMTAPDDWQLDNPRALTGYAPTYARTIHDVPSQIAAFRRGDSTLVLASWDARRDTTLLGRSITAALVLASDTGLRSMSAKDSAKVTGRIAVTGIVDSAGGLVSLELLARQDRRAARTRIGVAARVRRRIALSDLLLYAATAAPVLDLDAVRDSALASQIVPASRAVGVYWETYGLRPQGEAVRFSLSVEQVGVSWMRRAAERLRLADPTSGLRIQWEEVPKQQAGVAGRGVRLDLSRLRAGRYTVHLTITADGEAPTTVVREIEVR